MIGAVWVALAKAVDLSERMLAAIAALMGAPYGGSAQRGADGDERQWSVRSGQL